MSRATAAQIRKALKAELGLNARQVGVRTSPCTYSTAITVTIKVPIAKSKVKAIAGRAESIRRCEASGEILQGGNTYLTVEYAYGVLEALYENKLPTIEFCKQKPGQGAKVLGAEVWFDNYDNTYVVTDSGDGYERAYDAKSAGRILALWKLEKDATVPTSKGLDSRF